MLWLLFFVLPTFLRGLLRVLQVEGPPVAARVFDTSRKARTREGRALSLGAMPALALGTGLRSLASPHSNCTSCAVLKLASTSSLWLYNQSSRAHKRLCGCRLALPLALLLLLLLLSLLACTPRLTLSPTRGRDRRKWRGPMTAAAHAKLATWWGASAELPGRPLIAKRS